MAVPEPGNKSFSLSSCCSVSDGDSIYPVAFNQLGYFSGCTFVILLWRMRIDCFIVKKVSLCI